MGIKNMFTGLFAPARSPRPRPRQKDFNLFEGLCPVQYNGLTIFVTPDYYKEDGIRMPVGLTRALEIANERNMILPTPEIVDAIWEQADIRLIPTPLPPTNEMTKMSYFRRHDAIIEQQLGSYDTRGLKLIAGHKKDIVSINPNSRKVAIYGWHRSSGKPIQPYNARSHGREYRDYSHGLRLVSENAIDSNGVVVQLKYT